MKNAISWVDGMLRDRRPIAALLEEAGVPKEEIPLNRAFASRWAWSHGPLVVTTIWEDEIEMADGVPAWKMDDPANRDLPPGRLQHAAQRYDLLRGRDGGLVRAIVQRKRANPAKNASGIADKRAVDPVSWQVTVEGGSVVLRRLQTVTAGLPIASTSTQWELALQAVLDHDGPASAEDVYRYISGRKPGYKRANVIPDLSMLSVNSPSRTSYSSNQQERASDTGHRHDKLFKIGRGPGATYEPYAPAVHGVWRIIAEPVSPSATGFAVRRANDVVQESLIVATAAADAGGEFEPTGIVDARERVFATIVRRQGQPEFRRALLDAYEGRCTITGCSVVEILEAAHIHPYKGECTNDVRNGLLLRADIHTLFDLNLIVVDTAEMAVRVSPSLLGSEYEVLDGKRLRPPRAGVAGPSTAVLDWHRSLSSGWWNPD